MNDTSKKTKKIEWELVGEVTYFAHSPLVIEVPSDVTDEEIDQLPEEMMGQLFKHASQWLVSNGGEMPEHAQYVTSIEITEDCGEVEADVKADCCLVRGPDGKLMIEEE